MADVCPGRQDDRRREKKSELAQLVIDYREGKDPAGQRKAIEGIKKWNEYAKGKGLGSMTMTLKEVNTQAKRMAGDKKPSKRQILQGQEQDRLWGKAQ